MSTETFQVAYDGEGVVNGSIDVRLLAPALLALGELVKSANTVLNGDTANTSLRVESDFKTGSFEISLVLDQSLLETVKNLFTPNNIVGAAALFTAIFGAVKPTGKVINGLFKLYKELRGERPKTTLIDQSTRNTIFVLGDGNEVFVGENTAKLYADEQTMRHADQVVRPVSDKKMDYFEVKKQSEVIDRIEISDLPKRLTEPQEIGDIEIADGTKLSSTREVLLRITKPALEGGRWGFSDGKSKFGASIEDTSFNEKVAHRQEGFYAGDTLHVLLRTSQKIVKDNKMEVSYVVERVIQHTHAPQEQPLLLSSPEAAQLTEGKKKDPPPSQE